MLLKLMPNPSADAFNPVQLFLSLIVAPLIFVPVYKLLDVNTSETWMIYSVAFQNGFFWRDILGGGVNAAATGSP